MRVAVTIYASSASIRATPGAVKAVQPALTKFYDSLSDEQKVRFNSLRSAFRPSGVEQARLRRIGLSHKSSCGAMVKRQSARGGPIMQRFGKG